jgi:hypothetical protein
MEEAIVAALRQLAEALAIQTPDKLSEMGGDPQVWRRKLFGCLKSLGVSTLKENRERRLAYYQRLFGESVETNDLTIAQIRALMKFVNTPALYHELKEIYERSNPVGAY